MRFRFSLPMGRSLFFLSVLLVALIVMLPMRLVLGWFDPGAYGLTAREVRGSVWSGRLSEAKFGGIALGDLRVALDPLPLVAGRARIVLARSDRMRDPLGGAILVSRHSIGVEKVRARVDAAASFAPLPIATLDLADVAVRFRDGVCEQASGLIKAGVVGDIAGIGLPGGLTGSARCAGGALSIPLASQSGQETLAVRIGADGSFQAELGVRTNDPAARETLLSSGFVAAGAGYVLRIAGTL